MENEKELRKIIREEIKVMLSTLFDTTALMRYESYIKKNFGEQQ